jgi:hypothetical protein
MHTIGNAVKVAAAVKIRIEFFGAVPRWEKAYHRAVKALVETIAKERGISEEAVEKLHSNIKFGPKAEKAYGKFVKLAKRAHNGIESQIP